MRLAVISVVLALGLARAGIADARSEKTVAYPREQAWPAAVRFLRVDANLKIVEKDADAGYVLFELVEEKKTFRGSLEVVDVVKDGIHQVKLVIHIEDRPAWMELDLLNKLERKLRVELGAPATPPKREPTKDKDKDKDAPRDKGNDKGKDAPRQDDGPPISATP